MHTVLRLWDVVLRSHAPFYVLLLFRQYPKLTEWRFSFFPYHSFLSSFSKSHVLLYLSRSHQWIWSRLLHFRCCIGIWVDSNFHKIRNIKLRFLIRKENPYQMCRMLKTIHNIRKIRLYATLNVFVSNSSTSYKVVIKRYPLYLCVTCC